MTAQSYAEPAQTPLHAVHVRLGATLTTFAGWSMPLRFGSEVAEHHAVRTAAGLFDLSHMAQVRVAGPHAAAALDYALVGHASAITAGRARYSLLCADDGGILDDLIVYRLEPETFLVVANAGNSTVVTDELTTRSASFTVAVEAPPERALLALQGPAAQRVTASLADVSVHDLPYYAARAATLAGCPVLLARTGYTGEDGFEVFCAPTDATALWDAITDAGAHQGVVAAGLACRDSLRLEAGMPLYGHELSRDVTPFDVGLGRVVAFSKPGDFVGRAALARCREDGGPRTLVGLVTNGRRSPRQGHPVLDPATGDVVGAVTSGAPSPTLGHPIAMALVAPSVATHGTRLQVSVRGVVEDATVVPLPFYARAR